MDGRGLRFLGPKPRSPRSPRPRLHAQEGLPDISLSPSRTAEGHSGTITVAVTVPVYLSKAAATPVTVKWSTVDGTAVAGSDYKAATGTLTFEPGTTLKAVSLEVLGDAISEKDARFGLELSEPVGAVLADVRTDVLIKDDEPVTAVNLWNPPNLLESRQELSAFQVSVTNHQPERTVRAIVSGGTAAGVALAGSDTVDLGDPQPLTRLKAVDDAVAGPDRPFVLALENPGAGVRLLPNLRDEVVATLPPGTRAAQPPMTPSLESETGQRLKIRLPATWAVPVTAVLQSSSSLKENSWTAVALKTGNGPWTAAGAAGQSVPQAAAEAGFIFSPLPSAGRQFYRLAFVLD